MRKNVYREYKKKANNEAAFPDIDALPSKQQNRLGCNKSTAAADPCPFRISD